MLIDLETIDPIRILRMNNQGENRFTRPFLQDFNQALDQIQADPGARALVITGAEEKYFSTGLDLKWLMSRPKEEWVEFLTDIDRLIHRLFLFPKPAVAGINGHAFAGGLFLALAADWRVMRQDRGFCCVPEIDLGIGLPPGTIALIAYVAGKRNAEYLALTGKRLTAQEALKIGAIDEAAKAEEVLPRAVAVAKKLAEKNPAAYARHKLGLREKAARVMEEEDPGFIKTFLGMKSGS